MISLNAKLLLVRQPVQRGMLLRWSKEKEKRRKGKNRRKNVATRIASHRVYGKLRVHEAGINYTFDACREPRISATCVQRYAQSSRWHAWDKDGKEGVRSGVEEFDKRETVFSKDLTRCRGYPIQTSISNDLPRNGEWWKKKECFFPPFFSLLLYNSGSQNDKIVLQKYSYLSRNVRFYVIERRKIDEIVIVS